MQRMRTHSAGRHAATAAPWADLPLPLWEHIAARLPTADVLSLRQAWRGAAQLAGARVRSKAFAELKGQLDRCVLLTRGAVMSTAMDGVEMMLEQTGGVHINYLSGFMEEGLKAAYMRRAGCNFQAMEHTALLGERGAKRCSYSFEPQHTGIRMEVGLGSRVPACVCPLSFLAALRTPRVRMACACTWI